MAASKRRAVRRRRGRGAADFGVYRGQRQRRIRRHRLRNPTRRRAAFVRVFGNLSFSSRSLGDAVGNRCGGASVKSLIIFDLDGTLAESKSALDGEMAALLGQLLRVVKVAIISGGAWPQFEEHVLSNLPSGDILKKLSLLPTCGTKFYQFDGAWRSLYSEDFSADDKVSILSTLNKALDLSGLRAEKHWGDVIEDRGSQITFSALGQEAPLEEKKKWDPDFSKRKRMKAVLDTLIPEFSVHLGGATSIDVTQHGIDKAYGIRKLRDILHIAIDAMIFIGDAVFPGGN